MSKDVEDYFRGSREKNHSYNTTQENEETQEKKPTLKKKKKKKKKLKSNILLKAKDLQNTKNKTLQLEKVSKINARKNSIKTKLKAKIRMKDLRNALDTL